MQHFSILTLSEYVNQTRLVEHFTHSGQLERHLRCCQIYSVESS